MAVALELSFFEFTYIVGFIVVPAVSAIALYFRKMEKKMDKIEDSNALNKQCLTDIKDKVEKHELNVKAMFAQHQLDVKDDESQLKVLSSHVGTLTEKVSESEKIHIELKNAIKDLAIELKNMVVDQRDFMTKWNQRIEDRIEGVRNEFKEKSS